MIELVLKKPIIAHKETLHVLEIREPTYDEIEALGFPFSVSPDGGMKMDSQVALKYIPLLAGIPRSSAAQMTKHDCNAFFYRLGDGRDLRKRFYNVAWFWKLNPLELRRTAISHFADLEAEAVRINEEMKHG